MDLDVAEATETDRHWPPPEPVFKHLGHGLAFLLKSDLGRSFLRSAVVLYTG